MAAKAIDWDEITPRGRYAGPGKRVLDLVVIAATLPITLPLLAMVAVLNALVVGPRKVFFVQERSGLRGRTFRMLKFRTMRDDGTDAFSSWSGGKDEARVTRFGRFLRNCHLDELPQLVNVLRGEMSVIGPRPEMASIEEWANQRVPGFSRRLVIRPGITGHAQITQGYTGMDVEAYAKKLEANEDYLRAISLEKDLWILWRTARWMLLGRGWQWRRGPSTRTSD